MVEVVVVLVNRFPLTMANTPIRSRGKGEEQSSQHSLDTKKYLVSGIFRGILVL